MDENIFVTRSSMPPFEEYVEAIRPLWDSHWLTNMGEHHRRLEEELAGYLDVPEISLTVNGHMALELAIQSFDFPEGSEVITTPFTFISTTHAIVRNRLNPVFCDVREDDGTMDASRLEELITPKTVAILPVHVYGNVCRIEEIERIAKKYSLRVIYDAAHAFGVACNGKGIGNFGDVSIFSFHATKMFNTIEGGAVVCRNHDIYEKLYDLKNFGIRNEELVVSVGANAKMNEFAAVMGLCNLKHIDEAVVSRKRAYEHYTGRLNKIPGIRMITDDAQDNRNYGYLPIYVSDEFSVTRDRLYDILAENGIHARKYFYPLTSDQACFKNRYKANDLRTARRLAAGALVLPLFEGLEENDIDRICDIIERSSR